MEEFIVTNVRKLALCLYLLLYKAVKYENLRKLLMRCAFICLFQFYTQKPIIMKKLAIIIIISSFAGFVSCKKLKEMFGGSSAGKENVEEVAMRNRALQQKIMEDSIMHLQEMNMLRDQYEREIELLKVSPALQKGVKQYLVVVGSFKESSNAEKFAATIKTKGYEGAMVEGPNNFMVVTSATYQNLNAALEGHSDAMNKIASDAWIYVKR